MILTEDDGNQANVKEDEVVSSEMSDLDQMPSASQQVLAQESLVGEIPTTIPNVDRQVLTRHLEVMGDMSVGGISRNENVDGLEEKRDRLLEEVSDYQMEK